MTLFTNVEVFMSNLCKHRNCIQLLTVSKADFRCQFPYLDKLQDIYRIYSVIREPIKLVFNIYYIAVLYRLRAQTRSTRLSIPYRVSRKQKSLTQSWWSLTCWCFLGTLSTARSQRPERIPSISTLSVYALSLALLTELCLAQRH